MFYYSFKCFLSHILINNIVLNVCFKEHHCRERVYVSLSIQITMAALFWFILLCVFLRSSESIIFFTVKKKNLAKDM